MESSLDVIRLGAGLPERIAVRIHRLLASSADPAAAKRCLERLLQESPSAFDRIASSPAALLCAVNVFTYSRFLSDTVLKNPERLLQVANSGSFYRVLSAEEYEERLFDFLDQGAPGTAFGCRSGALPPPADAAHCSSRRDGRGRAGGGYRGAVQPGRRHSGFHLPPHPRATGEARTASRAWRTAACAVSR